MDTGFARQAVQEASMTNDAAAVFEGDITNDGHRGG